MKFMIDTIRSISGWEAAFILAAVIGIASVCL